MTVPPRVSTPRRHYLDWSAPAMFWFHCEWCLEPFKTSRIAAYCPPCVDRLAADGFTADAGQMSGS